MRVTALLLLTSAGLASAAQTYTVENGFLRRTVEVRGGHARTTSILNKLDRRLYAVESDEFRLIFVWERIGYEYGGENPVSLTAADFEVQDVDAPAAGSLAFRLVNRKYGIEVKLAYAAAPDDFYARKWLEIRSPGKSHVFLDQVMLESLSFPGVTPKLGGFGQPLYADNLFLGAEYPGAQNRAERDRITLSYYAGEVTSERPLRTESAVLGVAAESGVRAAFQQYISRIRSGQVRPVLVFNTWYDMQRETMTSRNCLDRMALLKQKLLDPYGLKLDSFVLDDGWDDRNTVWQIHRERFAGDFAALNAELRRMGSSLGLWFGPIGGYDQRALRIAAGRKAGYEITANGEYFCLAGPKYREKFKRTILNMVGNYGVTHIKFDGVPYGCNAPDHGHLLGVHSREAHLRAFIDILKSVRAADPKVFLNITTSNWLSPWWLQYADVVFMGGHDYGFLDAVPAVTERDKAITYRDKVLYDDFRVHDYQFPNSSLMTIGIIRGVLGAEGALKESESSWVRNAIMNFSRGSMMTELYLSPSILSDNDWRSLGSVIRWAHRNSDVLLKDTRLILGDPARREVYGYAHLGDRGIVTLRNPCIEPRGVSLVLDRSLGLEAGRGKIRARAVYPYRENLPGLLEHGSTLQLTVQGYQVVVLELLPETAPLDPVPPGVRYDLGTGGQIRTYAPHNADSLSVAFSEGRAGSGTLRLDARQPMENRRLVLLCELDDAGPQLSAKVRAGGTELPVEAVSPLSTEKGLGYGQGRWTAFVVPLGSVAGDIQFTVTSRSGARASGTLSAWLLADFVLDGKPFSAAAAPADSALPASSSRDSRTVHLFTRWLRGIE